LNTTLMPHSITHGDACFAYFNKIRGILGECYRVGNAQGPKLVEHRLTTEGIDSVAL